MFNGPIRRLLSGSTARRGVNMKRLTRLCENTQNGLYAPHVAGEYIGLYPNTTFSEVVERLAYYEDLEEHRKLVILPRAIGSMVYEIVSKCSAGLSCPYNGGLGSDRCFKRQCEAYIKACKFDYWMLDHVGKSIFLTRKEAEEALSNEVEDE